MSATNGTEQAEQARREARERQERQSEQAIQQLGLQQAMARAERIRDDLLDKVSDSDLNADARNLLENLVSKDFIFANLTDEEVTELKYKLLLKRKKFYAMHPAETSLIKGEFRAYVYDDPGNTLTPLTQQEKLIVDQFFEGVFARVTRARGMAQQEILQTQIQQSYTGNVGENGSSKGGLLGRWRS